MIKIENMKKIYLMGEEKVYALREINLEIKEKEFVSIVGTSGSGKSTLMNIIGLLDIPTEGKLYLDNKDVSKMSDSKLATLRNQNIGFIFQNFNLLEKLTALENVKIPLIYKGESSKKANEIAKFYLEKVGLKGREKHLPSQLSGGQQQRVAIARSLVCKPKLILADEPTGALDSKTGLEIIKILEELNKEGQTIILITHDREVAKRAKRILRISDGKIEEEGRAQ